ncbi:MAG: hypothetical protein ACRCTA_01235, partial [Bacilli bacterium]
MIKKITSLLLIAAIASACSGGNTKVVCKIKNDQYTQTITTKSKDDKITEYNALVVSEYSSSGLTKEQLEKSLKDTAKQLELSKDQFSFKID